MIKQFEADFEPWEEVQLKTEPGIKYLISGYIVRPGMVSYWLSRGNEEYCHQGGEIEKFSCKKPGFGK